MAARIVNQALMAGLLGVTGAVYGCDPSTPPVDGGGSDAPPASCDADEDCDDGLFCNGTETCSGSLCVAGDAVACDDGVACTTDVCSESRQACVHSAPDADGDGFGAVGCADGDDCDDTDANRFPGNVETCNDVDEDCDLTTFGGFDFDADGFVSSACCNPGDGGTPTCGVDCDDNRATTFPGALEVCDTLDQDCDGTADDGVDLDGFVDGDLDGVGGATAMRACAGVLGFSARGDDCDDENPRRYPGAPELCDDAENDCDAATDESPTFVLWYPDGDDDGFGSSDVELAVRSCAPVEGHSLRGTDCADGDAAVHPAALELCDGVDNNCNGLLDFAVGLNDWEDDDRDGIVDARCPAGGEDCDDTNPLVGEGVPELCDGADNDCDATVDEGVTSTPYYRDVDADGFGSVASGAVNACVQPTGFSVRGGDCADRVATRYPGAIERCNGADDDCDAAVDESCSSDCPDPRQVRCGGTCIDPMIDERFCGASLSCTGVAAGNRCDPDQLCAEGSCTSHLIVPSLDSGGWRAPDDTVIYTFDYADRGFPPPTWVHFTLDGTRPRISATSDSVYSEGTNEVTMRLDDGDLLRWVFEVDGVSYPERRYTHSVDPAASVSHGYVPEPADVLGRGPAAWVYPRQFILMLAPARVWRSAPTGACPTCTPQYVVSLDGFGAVACTQPTAPDLYPGTPVGETSISFNVPELPPGLYPLRSELTYETACAATLSAHPVSGRGVIVGWLVIGADSKKKK